MRERGTALLELVLALPLLLLLGGGICYFGYCQLLNCELNILAWEGAAAIARGETAANWRRTLAGRQLLLDLDKLSVQARGRELTLSYPKPKPPWAKEEQTGVSSISWERPPRK